MATSHATVARRRPSRAAEAAQVLNQRIEAVGPARFGVVAVDCAKANSRWQLANFYGHVLLPPTTVPHRADAFDALIRSLRQGQQEHRLGDLIVALERTGRYHLPLKRAFTAAGFEVRIVDPLATAQYRKPDHAGTKTDDIDLVAIHRAAVHGFGLAVPVAPPPFGQLQHWARHRRDLVAKTARLRCQIRDHLHSLMPGYAELFDDLFTSEIALTIPLHFASAAALRQAGHAGLDAVARQAGVRSLERTRTTILAWARTAPDGEDHAAIRQAVLADLVHDFRTKQHQIAAAEVALVRPLLEIPHLILLSIPGVNVVTAAEWAGELGPITAYASARAITGRAGLYPSRYQSGPVDRRDGPLVRRGNRRLRQAILRIADTLLRCNDDFRVKARAWELAGVPAPSIHVRIGGRFCRIAFHMVARGEAYRHPSGHARDHIIQKLMKFCDNHKINTEETMSVLRTAADHVPRSLCSEEAAPLAGDLARAAGKRGAGPKRLGEILPSVLVRLLGHELESEPSGESSRP
jgi:transposase